MILSNLVGEKDFLLQVSLSLYILRHDEYWTCEIWEIYLLPTKFKTNSIRNLLEDSGCVCALFSWYAVILHTMWKMPIFFWLKIEFIPYADAKCKILALCGGRGGYVIIVFTCIQIISINIVQINWVYELVWCERISCKRNDTFTLGLVNLFWLLLEIIWYRWLNNTQANTSNLFCIISYSYIILNCFSI